MSNYPLSEYSTMLPIFTKESDGVVMPSRVKLDGIKSQPQLNGKFGVTMGYDAHAARYIVAVDDGAFGGVGGASGKES